MLDMTLHLLSVLPPTQGAPPAVRCAPTQGRTLSWGMSLADKPIICKKLQFLVQTGRSFARNCKKLKFLVTNTSSTAQGGGGSFQKTKPIGEVGCCESRMAERIHWWTERWLKLCFLEWLQWLQWSPHPQLLAVVWCSAVVVVVWCSGVVVVMYI